MPSQFIIECDSTAEGKSKKARIIYPKDPEADFGRNLHLTVRDLVAEGFLDWEIDLRQVDYCNSITLGVFVGIRSMVHREGGRLVIVVRRHTQIRSMISLLKLDQVFKFREVDTDAFPESPVPVAQVREVEAQETMGDHELTSCAAGHLPIAIHERTYPAEFEEYEFEEDFGR